MERWIWILFQVRFTLIHTTGQDGRYVHNPWMFDTLLTYARLFIENCKPHSCRLSRMDVHFHGLYYSRVRGHIYRPWSVYPES